MILTYHKIGSQLEFGITTVSRRRFAGHLDLYGELGLEPVLAGVVAGRIPWNGTEHTQEGGGLAITFDDGYESVSTEAFPEMAARKWTGTVFVVVGSVGGSNSWDVRLSPRRFKHLSWDQIRELSEAGFEIGSHTLSHRDLTRLDTDSIRRELRDSKQAIEDHIGGAVTSVSYPFGRYSPKVIDEAVAAGYKCGFTSSPNSGSDRMAMGRLSVYSIDGRSSLERKLGLRPGYRLECIKNTVIAKLSRGTTLVKR
ncbi:polysaccharide deacetylase family protein [Candidatus Eisenbacteria bacterium]|uniref:Polysaccharide deacetylase family protein n=1 Tax=Eiseniibacteriota bacterium TaxID=2212470 RepID=A0ABV6YPH3_UNCEI